MKQPSWSWTGFRIGPRHLKLVVLLSKQSKATRSSARRPSAQHSGHNIPMCFAVVRLPRANAGPAPPGLETQAGKVVGAGRPLPGVAERTRFASGAVAGKGSLISMCKYSPRASALLPVLVVFLCCWWFFFFGCRSPLPSSNVLSTFFPPPVSSRRMGLPSVG